MSELRIKDLRKWPLLHKVALFEMEIQAGFAPEQSKLGNTLLSSAFCWSVSIEGHDFWEYLCEGYSSRPKRMWPHLFKGELT